MTYEEMKNAYNQRLGRPIDSRLVCDFFVAVDNVDVACLVWLQLQILKKIELIHVLLPVFTMKAKKIVANSFLEISKFIKISKMVGFSL